MKGFLLSRKGFLLLRGGYEGCYEGVVILQALYDMTSHKLQQKLFQLVYSHKYVLYNISKVLRNPSGGNY